MRQVVIPHHGGPEVLEVREAPDPVPGDGEVRIRVRAAGINFSDILARIGLYPDAPKPPVVVGYEVAGVVDLTGSAVTTVHPGDRVVALTRFGGYSDCVVVPAAQAFRCPEQLSDAEQRVIAHALGRILQMTDDEPPATRTTPDELADTVEILWQRKLLPPAP